MIRLFRRLHVRWFALLSLALLLSGHTTEAQSPADPAQTTVARLSYLEGETRVTAVDKTIDPVDAALNMPLWPGQSIQTGRNGAAEVEFTDGSVLRATESSSATLIRLETEAEIGLDDGLYYLELRAGGQPQFTVFAGEIGITPTENASLRIRVVNNQPEIAVLRGAVTVTRNSSYTVDLASGESLRTDPRNNRRYLLSEGIGTETWDNWNERRAQQLLDATASQTIAREDYAAGQGYGWSDLDASGTWYSMPGEGLVWQPYGVDAGFDPYGYGNWVYGGAGYVWASGYTWGWLPYRCGRWTYFAGFGWAWQPSIGCRSYGGGWPGYGGTGWSGGGGWNGGGFPVNHPPRGWHPPHQPPPPQRIADNGGIHIKRPTLPVGPVEGLGQAHAYGRGPRRDQPVQLGDTVLRPLAPVNSPLTPHGGSAVGSSLRRDFPIQNGTHRPLLGLDNGSAPVVPGRTAEWHPARPDRLPPSAGNGPTAPSPGAQPTAPTTGVIIAAPSGDWHRGVNSTLRNGGPVNDVPFGASGRAPTRASGQPPAGANGPAPTGANGLAPIGASGPPPTRTANDYNQPRRDNPTRTFGGAGATSYNPPPQQPVVHEPRPIQRSPEISMPLRQQPAPAAPPPQRMSMPAPAPSPQPEMHNAPPPSPAPTVQQHSQPGRANPN